jgi:hypothetical protein
VRFWAASPSFADSQREKALAVFAQAFCFFGSRSCLFASAYALYPWKAAEITPGQFESEQNGWS